MRTVAPGARRRDSLLIHGLLIAITVVMVVPFLWLVSVSLDRDATFSVPTPFTLFPDPSFESLSRAWQDLDIPRLYMNSLVVSGGAIVAGVLSAVLSGYAISKIRFRGAHLVLLVALATLMVPPEASVVPLFLLMRDLGLLNSYWAIYLPALVFSLGTFLCKQYFDAVPDEYREAAKIDGANELLIFFRVYLPLASPVVATLVILQFLVTWNDLLWPLLVLNDPQRHTIQIAASVYMSLQRSGQAPGLMAAVSLLTVLPVLAIYVVLQHRIAQSVASSGVRG